MPNIFAYTVLFGWPIVVLVLFRALPRANALVASIVGGYLLLPYKLGINLPVLPTYDKVLAPALSALVFSLLLRPHHTVQAPRVSVPGGTPASGDKSSFTRQHKSVPRRGGELVHLRHSSVTTVLLALMVITPVFTMFNNRMPIVYGPITLPGLKPYDIGSMILAQGVSVLPYLLARRYLATPETHRVLLRGLVLWGIFYTIPALYEVRMSPQLSAIFYNLPVQRFGMEVRFGGFRPVVFLQSGLWLAIFFCMTVVSAIALWRAKRQHGERDAGKWIAAFLWLLVCMVLAKSLGALVILLLLLPFALFLPVRGQLIFASVISGIVLTYPALRGADLVPVEQAVSLAQEISGERAQSLQYRINNENTLLARARLKPVSGWGSWGRNEIHDPVSGRRTSVTDGVWIIIVGVWGWLGYISHFGLLTAPIFLLTLRRKSLKPDLATSGLALALVANLCDMIPNATLTPVTWLVAGALMGRVAVSATEGDEDETEEAKRPAAHRRPRRTPQQGVRAARSG